MAQAKNDTPRVDAITPAGIAKFPRLNTPDDKFSPGEPKFDVQLVFDPNEDSVVANNKGNVIAEATALRDAFVELKKVELKEVLAAATAAKQGPKIAAAKKALADLKIADIGKPDVDDAGEETGLVILRAKMKQKTKDKQGNERLRAPVFFSAKGVKLVNKPLIGGGSKLKVSITMMPYHMASTNEIGVTFYLNAIQIIDLVTGGERTAAAYGFGSEDGYEADPESEFGGGDAGTPSAAGADEDF